MNKEIKYIISLILLFALMFSTIGLTINYHICGESGKKSADIFKSPKCSCEDNLINNESDDDLPSCCQIHNFATNQRFKSEVCCLNYETTVKINDSFIPNSFVKIFFENISVCYLIVNIINNFNFDNILKSKLNHLKNSFSITHTIILKFIEFFGSYDNEDNIISL